MSRERLSFSGQALDWLAQRIPFPEYFDIREFPSPVITITDPRILRYHPELVTAIAQHASSQEAVELSTVTTFGDGTWRSTIGTVRAFKGGGVRKAVVVGFATGPILATPSDGISMAERVAWFEANLNSLLHHDPPWVKQVCLTIPHFEGRSDRDAKPGEATMIEVFADGIVGARRRPDFVVTLEDHSFRLHKHLQRHGVEHVSVTANQLLAQAMVEAGVIDQDTVIASPDFGAVGMADDFAQKAARLIGRENLELVILDKKRNLEEVNACNIEGFLREVDVKDKVVVIRDDVGDSLRTTVEESARKLKESGAKKVILAITHAVHSKGARERLAAAFESGLVDAVFTTNSRPLTWEKELAQEHPERMQIIDVGPLLGTISASLLERGLRQTKQAYGAHLRQLRHPAAVLQEVLDRRNNRPDYLLSQQLLFPPPEFFS